MAKLGEGDQRWIVADRQDGKNVGNWHWSETNCLKFAEEGLSKCLVGVNILPENSKFGVCRITKLKKCDGDCYTYNRKGKMYLFYDMNLALDWEIQKDASETTTTTEEPFKGTIDLPNVSDDIESESMKISVDFTGKKNNALSDEIRSTGKELLQSLILSFLMDLKSQVQSKVAKPVGSQSEESTPTQSETSSVTSPATSSSTTTKTSTEKSQTEPPKKKKKSKGETVTLEFSFNCSPRALYEAITNQQRVTGFTGARALIDPVVGGKYELFDGAVVGEFQELQAPNKIVKTWRMKSWEEGDNSLVTISLDGVDTTQVKLTHEGIPRMDTNKNQVVPQVEQGWSQNYFDRLRAVFGTVAGTI